MRLSRLEPLLVLGVVLFLALLSGVLATLVRAAQPTPGTATAVDLGASPADEPTRAAVKSALAAVAPPGPAHTPPQPAIRVVAAQPAKPVLCARGGARTTTSERRSVAPAAAVANPCNTYVAECPAGGFPSGTFGVCTKNCEFGKPVPVNTDCAPEPTKPCAHGPPVPVSRSCPPEPTKPCEFGDPVPVGRTCPPEPTKPCEYGPPIPVSKTCPPEPTKPCRYGPPVPVSKICPPEPTKACQIGPSTPISRDCPPEPTKSCQFGPPVAVSQDCPPEPTKPCEFGDRLPVSQDCPDEPVWNCAFSDPVPVSQDCPPEPTKTCPNGVVTGLGDPCPQQTVTCPNGAIVATGERCPDKSVRCPGGQVVAADMACPAPMTVCPGGIHVPEGASCPPPPCQVRVSPSGTSCEPAGMTPTAASSPTGALMPVPASGELVLDKATVTGADILYARGAGCEPGTNVVLTTEGPRGTVEVVGQATADADGRFEAAVQFASLHAGYREVTANCGTLLVAGVDMVLTSSASPTSKAYVLLLSFLLVGSLVVHFQVREARPVRRR